LWVSKLTELISAFEPPTHPVQNFTKTLFLYTIYKIERRMHESAIAAEYESMVKQIGYKNK
jgi:hypothetical protein